MWAIFLFYKELLLLPLIFRKQGVIISIVQIKKSEDKNISLHFLHITPTPKEKNSRDLEHKSFDFLLV